jgi:hypothetical protein
MMRLLFILLLCTYISSCTIKKKEQVTDILLTNISENIKIGEIFDEFEYIPLETSEESIFGVISKLIVYENKFFILDNVKMKKIFVFDNDGTFHHTIGSVGEGPGEYRNIEDFVIDKEKKKVIILCYPSIAYIYDLDGNFIEKKTISNSAIFWNIASWKNGYVCSTNHQSATQGEDAHLIFIYDKDFNLRHKLFDVLPVQVALPSFISNPVQNNNDEEIVYFDCFTSKMHYINLNNPNNSHSVKFVLEKEAPFELYADIQKFFIYQGDYCFFIEVFYANNILWSSFVNKGKECIFIMNFETDKKILSWGQNGWLHIYFHQNDYFYSSINPLTILEGHSLFDAKIMNDYSIEYDSNPTILRFKAKKIL